MMDILQMIDNILKKYKGEDIDLCYDVLKLLQDKTKQEQVKGIEEFFEKIGCIESDQTIEITKKVDIEKLQKMSRLYSTYIKEMLTATIMKGHLLKWKKDKVYSTLVDELFANSLLEEMDVKAFSLLLLAQSDLLPYYEINDSIKMENDEFKKIAKNNIKSIQISKHILELPLEQKTEVASLLLSELLTIKDYKSQVVVMAMIINDITKNTIEKLPDFLKNSKEDDED